MNTIIFLILIAFIFFFCELFLPGGIMGIIGAILILAACVLGFQEFGVEFAVLTLVGSATVGAVMFFLAIRIIPNTKFGKGMINTATLQGVSVKPQAQNSEIINKTGEVLTTMAPTGNVVVDGKKYEALSKSGMLEKGTTIRVLSQDNFRLVVEQHQPEETS